jgi:hypothetical protein
MRHNEQLKHNQQQQLPDLEPEQAFVSAHTWNMDRPRILIVACSDGRYQLSLDEFLDHHLGITHYDRLYAPGGPGALASSALSYFRGEQFRQESAFLVEAHRLEEIIFIFHGPVNQEGPVDATCADYRRKMSGAGTVEIYRQQELDLQEAVRAVMKANKDIHVRAFRAEVRADRRVHYVPLKIT